MGKVLEADLETFRSDVDQRLWGPLYVVRTAIPKMTHGSITFLTGSLGSKPRVGAVVTEALFGAIEVLVRGLALVARDPAGRFGQAPYRLAPAGQRTAIVRFRPRRVKEPHWSPYG